VVVTDLLQPSEKRLKDHQSVVAREIAAQNREADFPGLRVMLSLTAG
jgi:hypothetical protein